MENLESFDSKIIKETIDKILLSIMFEQDIDIRELQDMIMNALIDLDYDVIKVGIDNSPELIDRNQISGEAIVNIRGIIRVFHFTVLPPVNTIINEED